MREADKIYLYPGDVYISGESKVVWTVLGSCIAIVLYNPRLSISAIAHAQLPEKPDKKKVCIDSCPNPCFHELPDTNEFKFVTCAITYMFAKFHSLGIKIRNLYGSTECTGICSVHQGNDIRVDTVGALSPGVEL